MVVDVLVAHDPTTADLGKWVGESLVHGVNSNNGDTSVDAVQLGFTANTDVTYTLVPEGADYTAACDAAVKEQRKRRRNETVTQKYLCVTCFMEGTTGYGRQQFGLLKDWAKREDDVVLQAVNGKAGQHNFWTRRICMNTVQSNLVLTIARKVNPALEATDIALKLSPSAGTNRVKSTPETPTLSTPSSTPPSANLKRGPTTPGSISLEEDTPDGTREVNTASLHYHATLHTQSLPFNYANLGEGEMYETVLLQLQARVKQNGLREVMIKLGVREDHVDLQGAEEEEDESGGLMGGRVEADGLSEADYQQSLLVLKERICQDIACGMKVVAEKRDRSQRVCAEVLLRQDSEDGYLDMRVAVCGNVDSGKSTLVGVLTRGMYDDGRGLVRSKVFNHKHEQETGRTSSVSERHLGFDSNGNTVNYAALGCTPESAHRISAKEISGKSAKVATLYDLAGHEKYLKTTVTGMTGSIPDYACIVVSANNSIQRMTKEHLGLCLALKIPFFVVITRMDSTPEPVIKATIDAVNKLLKMPSVKKLPYPVKRVEDVVICAKNIINDRITPIFHVSNVTGQNLNFLVDFLNYVSIRKDWGKLATLPKELIIDSTFFVSGVGTVVGGIITQGVFKVNDTVYLGPNGNGVYRTAQIKSIQLKGMDVPSVSAGHDAALALKKEKRNAIRKGNVLLDYDPKHPPLAYREFAADIIVLYHSTTIKSQYEPVIHCSNVRQSAKITLVGTELLRTGDKSRVHFRFLYRPEYMKIGAKLVFREGRTKVCPQIL